MNRYCDRRARMALAWLLAVCSPLAHAASGAEESASAAKAVEVASLSPEMVAKPHSPASLAGVADQSLQRLRRAYLALERGDAEAVRALGGEERAILLATLALKSEQPEKVLELLDGLGGKDPLAALLIAEAHRRQAVRAVRQAGRYARSVVEQKQMLAAADLSAGLREADARLNVFLDKLDGVHGQPFDILLLGPGVANVFMVDKARSRLFVYAMGDDGKLKRIADEYVVTGNARGDKTREGDGRTPNGVYRFVRKLQDEALEARYGPVAFPIDYPNELDRLHHKSGHGIWMHGYPSDVERRPPLDTRGCFALPNPRLLALADTVQLGKSWVVIGSHFRFGDDDARTQLLASVRKALESWLRDWMSLDTDAYLRHYHPRFHSGKRDLAAWKRYKKRVNASKTFIDVEISNLSLVHDPNRWPEGEIVVAEFDQIYRSNNYADQGRKRLYLARENESSPWRILIEETVRP